MSQNNLGHPDSFTRFILMCPKNTKRIIYNIDSLNQLHKMHAIISLPD